MLIVAVLVVIWSESDEKEQEEKQEAQSMLEAEREERWERRRIELAIKKKIAKFSRHKSRKE